MLINGIINLVQASTTCFSILIYIYRVSCVFDSNICLLILIRLLSYNLVRKQKNIQDFLFQHFGFACSGKR